MGGGGGVVDRRTQMKAKFGSLPFRYTGKFKKALLFCVRLVKPLLLVGNKYSCGLRR